jgi:hypothetical protein
MVEPPHLSLLDSWEFTPIKPGTAGLGTMARWENRTHSPPTGDVVNPHSMFGEALTLEGIAQNRNGLHLPMLS